MSDLRPTAVHVDKTRRIVLISWGDEGDCEHTFDDLRQACPCAACKNERAEASEAGVTLVQPVGLVDVEIMGHYGLQFWWDDGHSFGIYAWDYLHELCTAPLKRSST